MPLKHSLLTVAMSERLTQPGGRPTRLVRASDFITGEMPVTTFTTDHRIDFNTDLAGLATLTNKAGYKSFTSHGFTANSGLIFPSTIDVTGNFTNNGQVAGTVTGITLHLPLGGGDFTFAGFSIDLDTLIGALQTSIPAAFDVLFPYVFPIYHDIHGSAGNDVITGFDSPGWLTMHGGKGHDRLTGGAGVNTIYGELGNDRMFSSGYAKFYGGAGNDIAVGSSKGDEFLGGPGRTSSTVAAGAT